MGNWSHVESWKRIQQCPMSCVLPTEGVPLAEVSSMAVLKLEQDTEWHWRMVLLSCLDFLSTAKLSHRQGHLLDWETTAPVLHPDGSGSCRAAQKVFIWLHVVVWICTAATGQTSLVLQESGLKETRVSSKQWFPLAHKTSFGLQTLL